MSTHVLSLLVEDKPGLLTRVAGLFARRGFNIESLAVGASELEGLSRITVVVTVEGAPLEQVTKQLNKLINVIKIVELEPDSVQRVPIKHLQLQQGVTKLKPGMMAAVKTDRGVRSVVVSKVGKFNADVDFNHPLAGRTLYYEIEVVGIRDASAEEIAHGHVHGPGGHHH